MFKQFLKDSAVYGVAGVLSRGIALFLVPIYTRVLAPADYGMVDILAVFANLINLTVALEISQAVARYYAEAEGAEARRSYASTALWFTVAAFAVFAAAGWLGARSLSALLLDTPARRDLIYVSVAATCAFGVFYLAQNQLRWELRPRRYAVASLTLTLVTAIVSVVLVVAFRMRVFGVLLGQLVGNVVGAAAALYLARDSYRATFDWRRCREMLAFSLPLVPSSVAVFVALYVDRIAIKQLMTLADVGVFGIAYRVASLVGLLMLSFQGALTPLVYSHHRDSGAPRELARVFRVFLAIALLVWFVLSAFSPELLMLFTTPGYYGAATVVPVLVPGVLLANMYVFAPGLSIAKRTGAIALLSIAGAVANTALNFALVPLLGILGAAVATLVSAGAVFAGYMLASQRLYDVPHAWPRLALATAATGCAIAAARGPELSLAAALALKTVLLVATIAVIVELGLVRREEIRAALGRVRLRLSRLAV